MKFASELPYNSIDCFHTTQQCELILVSLG